MSLSELKEHGRVRPSFPGFHRLMKALCDHTDALMLEYKNPTKLPGL
jgi:hypothetical protein